VLQIGKAKDLSAPLRITPWKHSPSRAAPYTEPKCLIQSWLEKAVSCARGTLSIFRFVTCWRADSDFQHEQAACSADSRILLRCSSNKRYIGTRVATAELNSVI
jgi:hypothetical protein